jgi:hypothetical protein
MRTLAVVPILAALVLPAAAQIGNPAGVDPATPQKAPGVPRLCSGALASQCK